MHPTEVMDRLIEQYEGYFDIMRPYTTNGLDFLAYAHYYQTQEKYVLTRKAKLYGFEINEHCFFYEVPHLSMESWAPLKAFVIEAEGDFVKPHQEHMYSYISLILLCGKIDADVKADIAKLKYTKNYKFSLHGYSTVRLGAVDLWDETVITNRQGKELEKVLERALHS